MDWDIDAARKVTFDEEEKLSPPTAAPSNTPARTTPASRLSIDSLIEQEGAGHLAPVIKALYGQESGSGANNRTSVDGARSGMQVIPSTFSRFADKGWDINNEEHGLRAGIRYAKYLGDKFGNDPSKIAAGYFSGEGNVPRQGAGAFIRDTRDGNGKSVSGYVADIQRRLGPQQAPAAPSYPRWAEVAAKPEYQSMQPEEQDATRRRYFVENIAPQIPTDQLDATWAQFDADSRPKSNTERVLDRGKEFLSAITGTAPQQSVMEGYAPPGSPDTNKSPVIGMSEAGYNKYREQFLQKTPEQLQRLSAQGGVMGQLADRVLQEKSAYTAKVQSGLATKTDELAMTGRLAPATAEEKAAQPISAADFAKDLWTAIKGTPTAVAGTAASLAEGSDPTEVFGKKDWKDTAIEAARKQMADNANDPTGDAEYVFGITRAKLRNFPQQLSYSLLSMGAGLAAGLPTAAGVAATGVGAPAAPAAGYAAGAAAAGMAAYRMDTNGFLRDIRQSLDQAAVQSRGKPLTDEEFVKVAEKYQGLVQKHGLYEALPEAASQVFGFALGKTIVKNAMQGGLGALARGIGAAGLEFGNELGTETITQLGQHNTEVEAGAAGPDAKPRSFTSLKDIKDSAAEVLPDVLMLTGVMAGGAHVGGKAYAAAERKLAPGRVIGRELQSAVNGTEFTKEGIDQAARDALSPSGPEEVSPRQTSKASVAPAAEIAGGAGVATANAPGKDLLGADEVVPAGKNAIADELAQLEKPEATREEDKALGSEIAKALEPAYGSGSVSVVRPEALPDRSGDIDGRRQLGKDEYADIEQLGQLFGKRVVLFDSTNDQHPDAFVRRADNGTIYLNTKAADAAHSVLFGHELDHLMSREAPEIHKAWREAVMAAVPDLPQRAGEFYPNPVNPKTGKPLLTDEAHQAEIVADLMGNRFAEPEFRQTLFNNLAARSDGRTVLKKALDIIHGLIDKVKALGPMKKFKADALVSDLKKVRREAARALGKYVVMQQKATGANPDVTASAKRVASTPEFKKWFGDSKVVDEKGEPLVVYHGTDADFGGVFDTNGRGKTSDTGAFFSSSPSVADSYTGRNGGLSIPAYLSLQRVVVVDAGGKNWNSVQQKAKVFLPTARGTTKSTSVRNLFKGEWDYPDDTASTDDLARWARANGYDGLVVKNVSDRGSSESFQTDEAKVPSGIYVAFRPEQIKSAIGNSGAFDPANPDVTASAKRVASTPEFKEWFGDSKVVDEKGEPLVVYHGTNADFEAFDHDLNGSSGQGSGEFGFFFDSSPANAARYVRQNVDGGSVVPVFVSLQNPLRVEKYNRKYGYEGVYSKTAFFNFIDDALENGHDGAIFYDVLDRGSRSTQFVAFRPEQIKSAIGNSGAFDPTNPDITASARRGPYTTSRMAEMNRGFIEKKEGTAFKVVEEDGQFYLESTDEKPQGQADRAAAAQERPAEEPRAAVRDNGRPAQATPRHGKPREGAVEVEGVHFSTGERGTLVGGFYGSGLKGVEAERIAQSNDPRLKSRIYFYVNEGSGVKPEPGVGSIAHRAKLSNVYDASADNDGLFMRAKGDMNAFESAVLDAGYDGYYTRQAFSNMGAAVLLGSQAVNVQRIGQGAQDRSASAVAPPPVLSEDRKAADVLLKSNNLPSGARTGPEWATFLQKAAPQVYAALERNDLTSWLAGEGLLYRDQVGKKLREAIAGVTASAKRDDLTDTYAAENKTGVIVGARPGEFNWNPGSDGEPAPIQHPVQRGPRLEKIGEGVRKILSSKQVGALVSDLFGVQNLTVAPTLGSWQGKSEPSFVLAGDNLTFEAADDLSKLLGFAFAQDATAVTQPRFEPSEDEIPAFYVGAEKRLSGKQLSAILEAARAEGLDYTTATDGRAVKFLYFGDEDGLAGFQAQVDKIADAAKLPLRDVFFVRSSLNEAENYTAGRGGEAGQKPAWLEDGGAGASGLFGRAVDHLIVPYARLVGSEGYRFSPDRFGERFGLTADQVALIRSRLRPKSGLARSTAPLLTGEEKLDVQKNDLRAKEPRSNITDIMWALQNRAAQTGLIEPGDYSPEARKVIAQAIADEIIHHVSRPGGKSAIGWYDAALKRAKGIYDGLFPEIANDPATEMLFDAVLGITSQGNDVFANSLFAVRLYQLTNRQGMTLGEAVKTMAGSFGLQTRAIEGNLLKLEHLVNVNGYERMRGLFNEKKTVAEWNAILRRDESLYGPDGKPLSVEGAARQRVTGWMVFGPKIGSFINNLDGDYSTLTADLWFSRSWNRILGYSFIHSPQLEAKQYQRFKEEILAEHNGEAEGQGDLDGMTDREIDALLADPEAMLDLARGLEKTFREGRYKQKSDLRRAAKHWVENRDLSVVAPRSDHERAFQQDAMEDAQQIIKRKTGQKIEIADMQAALWYHEKELFRHFGASDVKREPADYADAAKRTAKIYRDGDLFYVDKSKPRYILGEKGDYLGEDESTAPTNPDVTASTQRDPAIVSQAIDRAIAREQGRRVSDLSRESATVKLRSLRRQLEAGKIDEGRFIFEVDQLSKRLDLKAADKAFAGPQKRVRGADFVRQKILEAKRNEDITAEEADFLAWFALKNPALLDDLGISVRAAKDHEKGAAGRYMPASRVMVLMRGATNKTTAVHETLHHLERLMPAEMQEGIRGEWLGAVQAAYREAVKTGDKDLQRYTELVTIPTMRSMEEAGKLLKDGRVDRAKYYQLLNASEFWAVRMTDIARRRFAADSIWAKSVQWLREALEHIKGALGLRSDAPMLRALNDLLKNGDGKAKSKEMLGLGMSYEQPAWHGSPHKFDKFSLDAIGTGEGAQAYGWGLYFAGKKDVAEWYRHKLAGYNPNKVVFKGREFDGNNGREMMAFARAAQKADGLSEEATTTLGVLAMKHRGDLPAVFDEVGSRLIVGEDEPDPAPFWQELEHWAMDQDTEALNPAAGGALYQVEIPEENEYLLWDKPLSEQPEKVRAVVEPLVQDEVDRRNEERERMNAASPGRLNHPVIGKLARKVYTSADIKGQAAYEAISKQVGSDKAASEYLHSLGIAGIKYLDGTSRSAGEGSYNYVVFDASRVEITDVQASVVRKALDARDNALRRLDAAVDGLANLPDQFDYLTDRYRTLGRIARVDEITSEIRKAFDGAGAADKQAVYDYLTNAGANANQIGPRDLRDMALRLKRTINYVGDQLVARGLLDPAVRAKFRDQYLPRMYLKHLMSNQDWKILGAGKKPSDMGYLKERKNIPEEVRELILGEVKDPAFLGANAIGRSMRDIAILDWLGKISQNGNWVFPGVMLDFKGQHVSAYYLKAEADRIEGQIPHYTPANQAKAKKLVQDMRDAARQALANLDVDHTLYKQIPDTHRYGMLRGLYVRKEIHSDIMGMSAAVNPDPTWFEKIFGMGHIGTKLTQYWKFTKVALNPPGQVRNFVSNMVMLQLSGVPLHKLPLRFAEAVRDIKANGPYWKVAKKYGVTESTFNAQELFRIKDDLLSLEAAGSMNPISWIKLTAAKVFEKVSDAYQFTEALGKTMKIIDVMKAGGTEAEAAIEAQKWLFDYSLVPQWARIARNSPVGMPFITYQIKVLPRLVEVATTAPWRLLPWVGLLYGMAYYAAASFGVDKDDLDKLKKALPEWLQDKGFAAFLPMKDGNGRVQVLDMSYFFPWTFYTDLSKHAMEGKGGKVLQDLAGMFSSPVIGSSANLVANYDSFTKKPIYNPADPPSYQAAAITNYLYDLMAPPVISSHGVVSPMGLVDKQYGGKLVQGLTGTTNKFGDPRATTEQALWSVLGVNFYGMDPEHTRATNLLTMSRKVQDAEARLKQKLYDRSLTDEQRAKAVGDYKERMMELGQEAKKYAEESQVPEKLKTRR